MDGLMQYQYRATAFSGVRTYDGVATGGVRICGVISCTGDALSTCGSRFLKYEENSTATFDELSIIASAPTSENIPDLNASDSILYPITLSPSILPFESKDYDFETKSQGNSTEFTIKLKNYEAEVYTFAIWGRVFERDGQEPTPPLAGSSYTVLYSLVLVVAALGINVIV